MRHLNRNLRLGCQRIHTITYQGFPAHSCHLRLDAGVGHLLQSGTRAGRRPGSCVFLPGAIARLRVARNTERSRELLIKRGTSAPTSSVGLSLAKPTDCLAGWPFPDEMLPLPIPCLGASSPRSKKPEPLARGSIMESNSC